MQSRRRAGSPLKTEAGLPATNAIAAISPLAQPFQRQFLASLIGSTGILSSSKTARR